MKICPNCGAENEDNILNCILCEFEFDMDSEEYIANENSDEISEAFQEENYNSVSENDNALINNENDTPSAVSYDEAVIDKAENSKSGNKIIPIIIVLTVIAAIIGGVIWYLTKNKNDTPDNDNVVSESTTEAASTEEPTEKVTEEAKTEALTEENTEPQTTVTILPYEEYEEAAIKVLDEFMDSYFGDIVMYGLVDISGEGVPELIIDYETEAASASSVYIFNGSDYGEPIRLGEGAEICFSEHLIQAYGYGGAVVRYIYGIDNHGELILKDEICEEYTGYSWEYTLNGVNITDTEYDEISRVYDSMKWEYVCVNEYKRKNAESQTPQASFSSDINDYPLYLERLQLIAQNIGSDYFDYGSGLSIAYTYSDTQFGYSLQDLNSDGIPELITTAGEMGDGASSVAEIYAISNNQLVMLCQTWDRLWYYMCENNVIASAGMGNGSGGVTYDKYKGGSELETIDSYSWEYIDGAENYYINGNRVSDDEIQQLENKYQGVTIDTMSLPNVSSSANIVTPCTIYGQIYAPDGGPINGYATSYIVEGGEYSCQRVDLMNNWHVTAVNSFTKNGVTWYELYDTDDGDYYGWLDEDHIKFY